MWEVRSTERKKRKHEVIRGGGPFFLLPERTWQKSSRDKGVTVEENTWSHIGNYKVERELKDGDPPWELISFKIKSTLEYKVKRHWSTILPPSKPPFPVTDTSTCLHTLLVWPPVCPADPLISQAPTAPACLSSLLGGEGLFFPQFLPAELPPIFCSFLPILLP